jgi:hypothetical protein
MYGWAVARAEADVVRLLLLYASRDCSEQVEPVPLQAALALWDYADRSAHPSLMSPSATPVANRIWHAMCEAGDRRSTEVRFSRRGRDQWAARAARPFPERLTSGIQQHL